ncbi:MAG: SCO family protein [Aestuariivirga sp.]
MPERFTRRIYLPIAGVAFLLLAALWVYLMAYPPGRQPTGTGTALVGGPFTLVDHTGKRVTEATYRGKYMLIFFGFTYCPDVCPTELQVMSAALDELGAAGEAIQPIFITVDPERDSPETMKAYVANFHPRMVGLTGSLEEISAVAKAYRVYFKKSGEGDAYLMDHSSIVYLMDKEGKFLKHFTYSTDAKALAKGLSEAIEAGG